MNHVIIYTILPVVGGNTTITLGLAEHFRAEGSDVSVWVRESSHGCNERALSKLKGIGCGVHRLPLGSCAYIWSVIRMICAGAGRGGVFISIGMGFAAPLLAGIGGFRKRYFYYINHDPGVSAIKRLGILCKIFDGLLVISPASIDCVSALRWRPKSILWMPQFSEMSAVGTFRKLSRSGGLRFGYIGSFLRSKGIGSLARSWPDKMPNATLHILGDGEDRPIIESVAASCSSVKYGGAFSAAERCTVLPAFFSDIDYLVVPSLGHGEGIPTVILEALSLGTPVIATDGGGTVAFKLPPLAQDFSGTVTLLASDDLIDRLAEISPPLPDDSERARSAYAKWFSDRVVGKLWKDCIK